MHLVIRKSFHIICGIAIGVSCLVFVSTHTVALAQTPTALCGDEAGLANYYSVPYPAKSSAAVSDLITCVQNHLPNALLLDVTKIYTYQQDVNLRALNYMRGVRDCGLDVQCQQSGSCHAPYSCHYGGRNGHDGAEAVDFNARNAADENQLYQDIRTLVYPGGPCHGKAKFILFESNHTHLSANSAVDCDSTNIPGVVSSTGGSTSTPSTGGLNSATAHPLVFLPNPIKCSNITCLLVSIIKIVLALLGLVGTAMFIYSGALFLTSGGNADTLNKARSILVYSTFGIIIIIGSWIIVSLVFRVAITGST